MENAAEPNIEFVKAMDGFREFGISKVVGYSLIKKGELPELLRDPATGRSYFLRHELDEAKKNRLAKLVRTQINPTPSNDDRSVRTVPARRIAA